MPTGMPMNTRHPYPPKLGPVTMTEQPTPSGSEPTTGIDTYTVQIRSELFPGVVDHLIKTHLGALAADLAEITGAGDWQVTFANAAGQTLAQHQSEHADALFD